MNPGKKNKKIPGIEDKPSFLRAFEALSKSGAQYLYVGGVAANLHGVARSTKDVDILIPKDLKNSKKILDCLSENLLWGIAKEISPEEVIRKPFTLIGDQPRVDLLLQAGKIRFAEAYPKRKETLIDGIKFPYVCIEDLILSKDTDRLQDKAVVEELKAIQDFEKNKNK